MLTLKNLKPHEFEKIVAKDSRWRGEPPCSKKKPKRWTLSDLFKKKK